MRGECFDKCNEGFITSMGGKLFKKAVKNMWETKGRKYCRHCRYGIVIENTHCPCCGRLFAVVPRNNKFKKKLLIDFVRY
jgi:hypothetical protein